MKNILWCFLLAGCAAAIPDQPTTRIEFMAPEAYPEGVAFDSISNNYYVTSARLGTVGKVSPSGVYSVLFTDDTPRSTYGIKVHPDGKRIVFCAADANYSKFTSPDTRKKMARLVSIDKNTGRKTDDIDLSQAVPGPHFPNDIAFDKDGSTYVTDSFANVIYKVSKDGKVSVFADSPLFKTKGVGLNGIVFHPAGYLLTVSSGTGTIYKVDVANPRNVQKVKTDQFFMNGDGLLLHGDKLVLVQNGGSDKIYELSSTDNWMSAKLSATTSSNDRFTYPSTATRAGDKVWIMNANFTELVDSTSVPSQKFALQHARFIPVPKKK